MQAHRLPRMDRARRWNDLSPHPDYLINFLGVRIDPKVPAQDPSRPGGEIEPVPMPADWHADIARWAAALRAVELARGSSPWPSSVAVGVVG
jgi:hypothetical protein